MPFSRANFKILANSWKNIQLGSQYALWNLNKGSFTNHVDKIWPIFDHPPTPRGQAWTFPWPPTYVHVDIHEPIPRHQYSYQKLDLTFGDSFEIDCSNICSLICHYWSDFQNFLFFNENWKLQLVIYLRIWVLPVFVPFFLHFSNVLSMWTVKGPPVYLKWTIVDI